MRVGFVPTPRAVTRDPSTSCAATEQKRGRPGDIARDRKLEAGHPPIPSRRVELDDGPDRPDRNAESREHALGMVARDRRLAKARHAVCVKSGEQKGTLDLRACDGAVVFERRKALSARKRAEPPEEPRPRPRASGGAGRRGRRRVRGEAPPHASSAGAKASRRPSERREMDLSGEEPAEQVRIVVPELPQSRSRGGAERPSRPTPVTSSSSGPGSVTRTPIARKHVAVRDVVLAVGEAQDARLPMAKRATDKEARWPMLLSDGTGTLPTRGFWAGWTVSGVVIGDWAQKNVGRVRRACEVLACRRRTATVRCSSPEAFASGSLAASETPPTRGPKRSSHRSAARTAFAACSAEGASAYVIVAATFQSGGLEVADHPGDPHSLQPRQVDAPKARRGDRLRSKIGHEGGRGARRLQRFDGPRGKRPLGKPLGEAIEDEPHAVARARDQCPRRDGRPRHVTDEVRVGNPAYTPATIGDPFDVRAARASPSTSKRPRRTAATSSFCVE